MNIIELINDWKDYCFKAEHKKEIAEQFSRKYLNNRITYEKKYSFGMACWFFAIILFYVLKDSLYNLNIILYLVITAIISYFLHNFSKNINVNIFYKDVVSSLRWEFVNRMHLISRSYCADYDEYCRYMSAFKDAYDYAPLIEKQPETAMKIFDEFFAYEFKDN